MAESEQSVSKSSLSDDIERPDFAHIPRTELETPNLVLRPTDFYSEGRDDSLAQKVEKIHSEPQL